MSTDWWSPGQRWLEQQASKEAESQKRAWVKAGRSAKTFRYNPPEWHRDAVAALGRNDEETFKAIKLDQLGTRGLPPLRAPKRHHATKKSPAQLQREIDEVLSRRKPRGFAPGDPNKDDYLRFLDDVNDPPRTDLIRAHKDDLVREMDKSARKSGKSSHATRKSPVETKFTASIRLEGAPAAMQTREFKHRVDAQTWLDQQREIAKRRGWSGYRFELTEKHEVKRKISHATTRSSGQRRSSHETNNTHGRSHSTKKTVSPKAGMPLRDDVTELEYHRPPTASEIRFGEGATHYRTFPVEEAVFPGTRIPRKWLVASDDGLRYYR